MCQVMIPQLDSERGTIVPCAFCFGEGIDPFCPPSYPDVCIACEGSGMQVVLKPYKTCSACLGTGLWRTHPCPTCAGAGVVAAIVIPAQTQLEDERTDFALESVPGWEPSGFLSDNPKLALTPVSGTR